MQSNYISKLQGTPVKKFFALLSLEGKEIFFVYAYAVINSIINLSLPLGIQAIMPLMTAGRVSTSIILLIVVVLIAILVTSGLQIMQYSIMERIQQRIFTKSAFEFAHRIPRMKLEGLVKQYSPELMNRFFDIMTVQKGLPKIVIDLTASLLQIVFSLLLLAFYSAVFAFYGLLVLVVIVLLFYFTSNKGLSTSLMESKYKYKVAHWLEELSRSMNIFKLAGYTEMPLRHTDGLVSNYLKHRKDHFRVLINQYSFIILFKALITGGLLIIGVVLVASKQINLGQFVASEIIIIIILGAAEKLFSAIETIYDVLTGVEKISMVTDKELETEDGVDFEQIDDHKGLKIELRNVTYQHSTNNHKALDDVSLIIESGEKVCVCGYAASGCSTLINLAASLYHNYDGTILFNGLSMRNLNLISLRSYVGENLNQNELMNGTIAENISMGRDDITFQDVLEASDIVNLKDYVDMQPEGFDTQIIQNDFTVPFSISTKINLARSIAEKPRLFVMDQPLQHLDKVDKVRVSKHLTNKENDWTLLVATNDLAFVSECEKIIVLDKGKVRDVCTYEEIQKKPYFNTLFET